MKLRLGTKDKFGKKWTRLKMPFKSRINRNYFKSLK